MRSQGFGAGQLFLRSTAGQQATKQHRGKRVTRDAFADTVAADRDDDGGSDGDTVALKIEAPKPRMGK